LSLCLCACKATGPTAIPTSPAAAVATGGKGPGGPVVFAPAGADTLRIGTIAPPGSQWGSELRKMAAEVKKATKGAVKIKFTYVDIAGDEGEVFRMIEDKKLDGAAITGVGIDKIAPAFLVQQLPLIFRDYDEVDCSRSKLAPKYDAMFLEKGYVPLGYSDVGFVHVFTKDEVRTQDQLEKIKMWAWEHDRIGKKMMELAGINAIKRAFPDVSEGLKKGELEGFYGSPYGVMVMHWHHYAKFMITQRLAMVVGAMVVTQAAFDAISEPHRAVVKEITARYSKRISEIIRKQDEKARAHLLKKLTPVRFSPGENSMWITVAEKTQQYFVDKLYPRALLDELKSIVAGCRKSRGARK